MTSGAFTDYNGYLVDVGTVVGFTEYFEEYEMSVMNGQSDLSYVVLALPDLGNMVEMSPCLLGEEGDITDILTEKVISVEPWRIGAI